MHLEKDEEDIQLFTVVKSEVHSPPHYAMFSHIRRNIFILSDAYINLTVKIDTDVQKNVLYEKDVGKAS